MSINEGQVEDAGRRASTRLLLLLCQSTMLPFRSGYPRTGIRPVTADAVQVAAWTCSNDFRNPL